MRWSRIGDTLKKCYCIQRLQAQHGRFSEQISSCRTGWQTIASLDRYQPNSGMLTAVLDLERLCNLLQVFYIPQSNTKEMGPTLFLPGSHIVPIAREELDHFGHLAGQAATVAPAGSVFFTAYSIWHRQSEKIDQSTRNLLKWEFWRTVPPKRDWIVDSDFDFAGADYSYTNSYFAGATRKWQSVLRVAEMFYWLCGKKDEFHVVGGSGWPFSASDPGRWTTLQ